ncbi:MAG: transglutaminase-like domain-containing protein [Hyphomicrobiales bacterium]
MATKRMQPFWTAGILASGLFLILLLVRMDVFERFFSGSKPLLLASGSDAGTREVWMNIYQNNRKIGFAHSRLAPQDAGYELQEKILMRINSMGMVQDLHLQTRADLLTDLSLNRFDFEVASGQFRFSAKGTVSGESLSVYTETAGAARKVEIALKKKPYLAAAAIHALSAQRLRPGDQYSFDIFDPSTMAQSAVQAEVIGREDIQLMGSTLAATRISMSLRGMTQTAWIGDNGELLRERGLLGMRLERTSREEALNDLGSAASEDLAELASVASNRELPDSAALETLRVRIGGIPADGLHLRGGRQSLVDGILTVRRESLADLPELPREQEMAALERVFLKPEPLIQSDHERIRSLVRSILGDSPHLTPLAQARRLVEWVHLNIEKRPVLSLPDALSTLENRMGDCNEHAMLLAALARAAGIPARIEAGLVYLHGRFYYHAWDLLFLGRWITADAVFGQMPADVTHLRLVTGSTQQHMDLAGVIGKITIEILDPS